MRFTAQVALAAAVAAISSGSGTAHAIPDVLDCGNDKRGEFFDTDVPVDFPLPPPQATHSTLEALGCPPEGEPTYGPGWRLGPPRISLEDERGEQPAEPQRSAGPASRKKKARCSAKKRKGRKSDRSRTRRCRRA